MTTETRKLLIDECRGVYIPNYFYNNFDFSVWGLDKGDYPPLSEVNHPEYWEAWDSVLRDAIHVDSTGCWMLEQDGSLYAIQDVYD